MKKKIKQSKTEYLLQLENGKENYYSNNYIEHESTGHRNKTLPIKEHLDDIKPCLKDKMK